MIGDREIPVLSQELTYLAVLSQPGEPFRSRNQVVFKLWQSF